MTSRVEPELVLLLNSSTGEIVLEGVSCDGERNVAEPISMREFRTGLVYEAGVAASIIAALKKKGRKTQWCARKMHQYFKRLARSDSDYFILRSFRSGNIRSINVLDKRSK